MLMVRAGVELVLKTSGYPTVEENRECIGDSTTGRAVVSTMSLGDPGMVAKAVVQALALPMEVEDCANILIAKNSFDDMRKHLLAKGLEEHEIEEDLCEYRGGVEDLGAADPDPPNPGSISMGADLILPLKVQ